MEKFVLREMMVVLDYAAKATSWAHTLLGRAHGCDHLAMVDPCSDFHTDMVVSWVREVGQLLTFVNVDIF